MEALKQRIKTEGVAVGSDRRRPSNPSGIARTRATTTMS